MPTEIERKFIVNQEKWVEVKKQTGTPLLQGYLLNCPDKSVRVRMAGHKAFLTIKGKTTGATRQEFEYSIPAEDAEILLNQYAENIISKTRYKLVHAGKEWEIDEFHGQNAGLVMAEIELLAENERFELPDWAAEEVTHDARYYNTNLAVHPYGNW